MATIYPEETLRALQQKLAIDPLLKLINYRLDTVQEIGDAVKCYCPIHREAVFRTLIIDKKSSRYKCSYSLCPGHKGGDLIDLFAKSHEVDYDEAIRRLVQKLGLEIDLPPADDFIQKTLEVSENYLTLHSYDDAATGFKKIVAVQPDNTTALKGLLEIYRAKNEEEDRLAILQQLATVLIEAGEFAEAAERCQEFLEARPDDVETRMQYIDCLVGQEDTHKALEEYMRLADRFETEQDFDQALSVYRKIEALNLDIIDVYPHILQCMVASGRSNEAIEETLRRAADQEQQGNYERALECYSYVLEIEDSRTDVRDKLIDTAIVAGLNEERIAQCLGLVELSIRDEAYANAARALEKLRQAAPGRTEIISKHIDVLRRESRDSAALKAHLELVGQLVDHGKSDEAAEQLRTIGPNDTLPLDLMSQLASAQRQCGLSAQAAETYESIASKLQEKNRAEEAADVLQVVIELKPSDIECRRRQIDLYVRAGRNDRAGDMYIELLEQSVAQQKWEDASEIVDQALQIIPDNSRLLEFRAEVDQALGKVSEAQSTFVQIARTYVEAGNWDSSRRLLERVLNSDPNHTEAAVLFAEAAAGAGDARAAREPLQQIASHLLGRKDYEKAETILKKLNEMAPTEAITLVQLATVYRNLERESDLLETYRSLVSNYMENEAYAKALEYCTSILDRDPENIWALEQMIRICEETDKTRSVPELCQRLAQIYEKLDDSERALELYERAIETDSSDLPIRTEFIQFLTGLRRYESASQQALVVIQQMSEQGRHAEAIQITEGVLKHTPDDIDLRRGLIDLCRQAGLKDEFVTHCTQLINIFYRRNEFAEVVDLYRELLERQPDNITFRTHLIDGLMRLKRRDEAVDQYFELARYYMRQENYEDAESTLIELLDQSPGNPRGLEMLIDILIEAGRHEHAIRRIRELSEIYVGVGKNDKAVEILRRVLAFEPENREIRRRISEISREDDELRSSVDDLVTKAASEWKAGNITPAIEAQREAARLRPEDTNLRHRLSEMLAHHGSTMAAVDELIKVARIRTEQGDFDNAMEAVEEILERDANHPMALRLRAELFAKMGDHQRALDEFLRLTPSVTPAPRDSTGYGETQAHPVEPLQIVPEFNFDNFVVGEHNRFAHATMLAVAKAPAVHYNPLFLYSDVGLGKTHLISAIANYLTEKHDDIRVTYTNAEEFTGQLVEAIQNNTVNSVRNKYKSADVLLVDDIQFLAGKERAQEEFFHIFNTLFQSKRQIVVTSDRPPKDIARLEKRLKSRFGSGVIVDIQAPDIETRTAILKKELMRHEGVGMEDSLIGIIAKEIKTNIRDLKGALNQVLAKHQLSGRDISAELVNEVLDMHFKEA